MLRKLLARSPRADKDGATTQTAPLAQEERLVGRDCVYTEAYDMLMGSVLICLFAEIRTMAREGGLVGGTTTSDLDPPLTIPQTVQLIQANKEALAKRAIDHAALESRLLALKHAQSNQHEQQKTSAVAAPAASSFFNLLSSFGTQKQETPLPVKEDLLVLKTFRDERSHQEIVHAVVVNQVRRRITVLFRGSVTQKDFLQDAKCAQKKVTNPVHAILLASQTTADGDDEAIKHMPETFNLHAGFHEYLFLNADSKTRMEIILEDIKTELRLYPGSSVYFTGHSLGGALATLCGFYAACDAEIIQSAAHNRVVIYSIASPFCGNWKFRYAFQELERTRRLQHLRMANLEDMVTLLPFAVPKATAMSPALSLVKGAGNLYKHVGIKLQLRKELDTIDANSKSDSGGVYTHTIVYPKEQQCQDDEEYAQELKHAMDAGKSLIKAFYYLCKNDFETIEKYHSCDEYEARLETFQQALSQYTLDDLYHDKTIVGNLFCKDYQPVPMKGGMSRALKTLSILSSTSSSKMKKSDSSKQESNDGDEEEQPTLSEAAQVK